MDTKLDTKPFYLSKTLWFNLLFVMVAIAAYFGFVDFKPEANVVELAAVLVSVINLILRLFFTKTVLRL